jgi:glycyl-tRNA synthetase beta chain
MDTLMGIFGIGLRPTGAKDPYGLRRASISVIRILIEGRLSIDLLRSLEFAEEGFGASTIQAGTTQEVFRYIVDRLSGYYQEKGVSADTVDAVLAVGETTPLFIDQRISAVERFRRMSGAMPLAAVNKRIKNILAKSGDESLETTKDVSVDTGLFSLPAEIALWQAMLDLEKRLGDLSKTRRYEKILGLTAELQDPVDNFFTQVMVNVDDPSVRENRLSMLKRLMSLFLNVADISRLH